jgi:polyisoprenoid-binding protein YceI
MSATAILPDHVPAGTYDIDQAHSNVGFEVKHMGIATIRGQFKHFSGVIDASGEATRVEGTVEVASIDTGEVHRDSHLKSPDFFDAERFPWITLHSAMTETGGDGAIKVTGEIAIKGIMKPIELTGTLAENGKDPSGNDRIGIEVTAVIDRREFDLKLNQPLPNGSFVIGNEVKIVVSVEAVKEA